MSASAEKFPERRHSDEFQGVTQDALMGPFLYGIQPNIVIVFGAWSSSKKVAE